MRFKRSVFSCQRDADWRSVCQQHVTPLQRRAFLSLISLFICAILQKCFYKTTQLKTENRKFQFVTARVVSAPDVVFVNVNEAGRVTRTVSERDARVKTDSAAKKLELSFNRALPLHRCGVSPCLSCSFLHCGSRVQVSQLFHPDEFDWHWILVFFEHEIILKHCL